MASVNPWNRRDKESVQAYEAFTTYLLLGTDRSLAKVSQQLSKSGQLLKRWSARHEWQLRTLAYEEHFAVRALDATEDERIELMREHLSFSTAVLRRARARLEHVTEDMPDLTLLNKEERQQILDELGADGRLMTVDQAIRAGDLAVKVGRLATGLDGKYLPPGAGSTDISGLDTDDLDRLEALLEKAKK